jgi:CubicO group peptidase (beta-lactamase class C family)
VSTLDVIENAIEAGAFPGACWAFGTSESMEIGYSGQLTYEPSSELVSPGTIYDLASLTKVIATTSVAMLLSTMEEIDIETPIKDVLPEFNGGEKDQVTWLNLLLHNAGLPPHLELWKLFDSPEKAWEGLPETKLIYSPGTETQYSCIGFLILSMALEKVLNGGQKVKSLREFEIFAELSILCRLQMGHTTFRPGPFTRRSCAPTEIVSDGLRNGVLVGEVHDENAWFLGGVGGNSGLFSTAGDIGRFAQCYLRGGEGIFREDFIRTWTRRESADSTRALGWDTKNDFGSSAGDMFGEHSFGHLGFTGTSLWIDPVNDIFGVLLTNRVHPTRENALITEIRPEFYDAVYWELKG